MPKKLATLLLVGLIASIMAFSINNAAASSTNGNIIITEDGNVTGTDKILRSGNLYTIMGNLSGSVRNGECLINVHRDNIVLDGAGHTISGSGSGIAIQLQGISNVTVKNVMVDNFGDGVDATYEYDASKDVNPVTGSKDVLILNNTFKTTYWGVALRDTNNSVVSGNTVTSGIEEYGINVLSSHNNTLIDNEIIAGSFRMEDATHNVFINNTVGGKLFVYIEDASNQVVEDAGQVWLVNCNNMTVKNVSPPHDLRVTVQVSGTNNSHIEKCSGRINLVNSHFNEISGNTLSNVGSNVYGVNGAICLSYCNSCRIDNNEVSANNGYCIYLEYCNNNTVENNKLSSSTSTAIECAASKENRIYGNTITDSDCGIDLTYILFPSSYPNPPVSNNNQVYSNSITNCVKAIAIRGSHENLIFENNITASINEAVSLFCSDDNTFYHNNFINNKHSAYETHEFPWAMGYSSYYSKNNTWDDGYPSGGNYWSDYTGVDNDNDGIGDTNYTVFENQTDRYPLMDMYTPNANNQTVPAPAVSPSPSIAPTPNSTEPLTPIFSPTFTTDTATSSPYQTAVPSTTPTQTNNSASSLEDKNSNLVLFFGGVTLFAVGVLIVGIVRCRGKKVL